MSDEHQLAALWHWLLPHCEEFESVCDCGSVRELVPPEHLYHVCRACYPKSFTEHLGAPDEAS